MVDVHEDRVRDVRGSARGLLAPGRTETPTVAAVAVGGGTGGHTRGPACAATWV